MPQQQHRDVISEYGSVESVIAGLAGSASIEINFQDIKDLATSRSYLSNNQRVFVSFLPGQTWDQTESACRALKDTGLDPIPHIPVRLIDDEMMLDGILRRLTASAGVREILLLSGDYPQATGVFTRVEDALKSPVVLQHGLQRISFAGHPEGHPKVAVEEIRRAERAKSHQAAALGLHVNLVTQFFFESAPFLNWAGAIQSARVPARLVAGLAGPAKISTLFKYALRCGAGPSIRALGVRPSSIIKLMGEQGPERVLRELAVAHVEGIVGVPGIHLFCFGGYLRTCQWLHRVGRGEFTLSAAGGFELAPS